jgi:hypothetical protein
MRKSAVWSKIFRRDVALAFGATIRDRVESSSLNDGGENGDFVNIINVILTFY